MTIEQVEAFLAVITYGTISAAADHLFISQSTVSNRLQQLEIELKTPLMIRQKGSRTIELTPYGHAFLPIAEQWAALLKDTHNLQHLTDIQTLNIASVDAVNNFTLLPLFYRYLDAYPKTKLSINTFHSEEIHGLIENRVMDIGFVFSQVHYKSIITKPIYRELMYLVCHKDSNYYDNISPAELKQENEIYLRWGPDFQQWHDQHWDSHNYYLIRVNTGSMLQHYLQEPNRWAIAPMSVISAFKEKNELTFYKLSTPPPPRICYQLTNRYPKGSRLEAIKIFEQELTSFINENESICTFEDWMLKGQ